MPYISLPRGIYTVVNPDRGFEKYVFVRGRSGGHFPHRFELVKRAAPAVPPEVRWRRRALLAERRLREERATVSLLQALAHS